MLRRVAIAAVAVALAGIGAAWLLTAPDTLAAVDLPAHEPDAENGRYVFFSGGCASCHATPGQDNRLSLGGGQELNTPFGTFRVPNISPHPDAGIGDWSDVDFINAMTMGVSPGGRHYYPSFPYTSYQRMPREDLMDLKAFIELAGVGRYAKRRP